jgi:dolichyl-phosphate-mannose--protein O-mannosyl transferase
VRLRHVDTGNFLMSTGQHQFGHPIEGQREVACAKQSQSPQTSWTAMEGLYVKELAAAKKK